MFSPSRVTVGATATLLFSGRGRVRLDVAGSRAVWVGPDASVAASAAAAYQLPTSVPETFEFFEETELWGICGAALGQYPEDVDVLATDLPGSIGLSVTCS
jgi:hypothetical protein